MTQPRVLTIPPAMRRVWALFVEAVTERPEDFHAAFAILCKQCARKDTSDGTDLLRLLADAEPVDVATTMLAYLGESIRKVVSDKLREDPAARAVVLDNIGKAQVALREAVRDLVREGKAPELRLLTGAA